MNPEKNISGFLGPEPPPIHLVGSDKGVTGKNPDVEARVRKSGEMGDAYRALFSPLSLPEDKREALKVLQTNGVQISPAALARLRLA